MIAKYIQDEINSDSVTAIAELIVVVPKGRKSQRLIVPLCVVNLLKIANFRTNHRMDLMVVTYFIIVPFSFCSFLTSCHLATLFLIGFVRSD
ncbi:Uncharacterized protein APZ42_025194 [Daphnia magna]|uniref:Uncharacterized protein n=1 Tax=Daphnia magna TaxID=35525 RepID=A0A0P6B1D7_9CRUS|nr:Uncharacterized protein APZ42_025194 [Daphnia magna]